MKKWLTGISTFLFVAGIAFFLTSISINELTAGSDPGICMDDRTNNGNKANICHVPPGNPDNAHTISVSINALAAHVGSSPEGLHGGDSCGACAVSTLDPCDQSSSLDGCINDGIYY